MKTMCGKIRKDASRNMQYPKAVRNGCAVTLFLCILGLGIAANAAENFGGYPNGADDFSVGMAPPPGTGFFENYLTYYYADTMKYADGGAIKSAPLQNKAVVDTLHFLYTTNQKVLGLDLGVHMVIPLVDLHLRVQQGPVTVSEGKTGVGDITVSPLLLSYHSKNLHYTTGVDIIVPAGSYDKSRLANTGGNYWSFMPLFMFTYLTDGGFEITDKLMYNLNLKNKDTEYQTGQEFHMDYAVGQHFGHRGDEWTLGIAGAYYKQVTDDKINGRTVTTQGGVPLAAGGLPVSSGFKGRVFSIGPDISYNFRNMVFTLKYQKETMVENRPEGYKLWFNAVFLM